MDTPIITPTKRCTKCGNEYPATTQYFGRRASAADGFTFACKACKSAHDKQYNRINAEKIAVTKHKHYLEIKDQISVKQKEYRALNRDRINKRTEQWRAAHPEARKINRMKRLNEEKAYKRAYRLAFPEKHRADQSKRRARGYDAGGRYTDADVHKQYALQKGRCHWCGCKVGKTYHVDHVIPLSKGGSNDPRNIVISCPECNLKKHDKMPHEFSGRLF
jgi:5-methylcytosine-specific restriction endonuclease McrA